MTKRELQAIDAPSLIFVYDREEKRAVARFTVGRRPGVNDLATTLSKARKKYPDEKRYRLDQMLATQPGVSETEALDLYDALFGGKK